MTATEARLLAHMLNAAADRADAAGETDVALQAELSEQARIALDGLEAAIAERKGS